MAKKLETVARQVRLAGAVLGEVHPANAKSRKPFGVVAGMARDVEKLVRHRADDRWTSWVRPLADLMVPSIGVDAFVGHVLVIAPHLAREADEIAETAEAAIADRQYWTATKLGVELGLSRAERKALGITTLRAVGMTATAQREEKRARDAVRQRAKRQGAGRPTRDIWISESVAEEARRTGVARSTIYRRRARFAECNTCVASKGDTIGRDTPVAGGEPGAPGRARSPAQTLAEVVVRSTGAVPDIVVVESGEARVVFPPMYGRLGTALADHLGDTLKELGFPTIATFDGRSGVHLRIGREAA